MILILKIRPCGIARSLSALQAAARSVWGRHLLNGTRLSGRVLACAGAALAFCTVTTAHLPAALGPQGDFRIARLEAFFQNYNCPKPRYVSAYLRAADQYGLDYRLLPAVSLRETGCGAAERNNNRWGYHPGRQAFNSVQEGIEFMARTLTEGLYYRGKPLHQKLLTYNPRPAYPGEVKRIMQEIDE